MAEITAHSSLQEVAAIISQALVAHGVDATLSGGAAVSIYTDNRYQSHDLDFVSTVGINTLARVVNKLGFVVTPSRRLFAHPESSGCRHQQPADLGDPLWAVACDSADTLCDGSARCLCALARPPMLGTSHLGRPESCHRLGRSQELGQPGGDVRG